MARADAEKIIETYPERVASYILIANSVRRDTGVSMIYVMREQAKNLSIPGAEFGDITTVLCRVISHGHDIDQFFGECAIKWIEKL